MMCTRRLLQIKLKECHETVKMLHVPLATLLPRPLKPSSFSQDRRKESALIGSPLLQQTTWQRVSRSSGCSGSSFTRSGEGPGPGGGWKASRPRRIGTEFPDGTGRGVNVGPFPPGRPHQAAGHLDSKSLRK